MVLSLCSKQINVIQSHAERAYPEECCGLLAGRLGRSGEKTDTRFLSQIILVENNWTPEIDDLPEALNAHLSAESNPAVGKSSGKSRRYWIDPRDLLAAQRYTRDRKLDIIGIYHSHPDHAALPSECDRALAWPEYSYLIVSVQQGKATDLRSWRLDPRRQFQPEPLLLSQQPQNSPPLTLTHPSIQNPKSKI